MKLKVFLDAKLTAKNLNDILNEEKTSKKIAYEIRKDLQPKADLVQRYIKNSLVQHDVIRELRAGPTAQNFSQTLIKGNLFSFLGFTKGTDPTQKLINYFNKPIQFSIRRYSKKRYRIKYLIPSYEEAVKLTQGDLEWISKSWVDMIENGFTNLAGKGRYYFSLSGLKLGSNSRSGTGIMRPSSEVSSSIRGVSFISDFIKKIEEKLLQ